VLLVKRNKKDASNILKNKKKVKFLFSNLLSKFKPKFRSRKVLPKEKK